LLELRGTFLLEDLEAVRDYLVGRGIPKVCPVGSSMGGWAAAWFALRHPASVPACVLIAPAIDFLRSRWALLTPAEREQWKRTGRLPIQNQWVNAEIGYGVVEEIPLFPVEQLAAELSRPVLILHGLKDDVVPFTQSLAFVERAIHPEIELHLFKNGDHRLLAYKDEMAEAAAAFFVRHLSRSAATR
jgi:alpha-beta hydrolase superfamily lysophospholipase